MNYLFLFLVPEIILLLTAGVVLLVDGKRQAQTSQERSQAAYNVMVTGCFFALVASFVIQPPTAVDPTGMLAAGATTLFFKNIIIFLTVFAGIWSIESDLSENVGEYFAMLLIAAVGMMLMAASQNLLMAFVALEITSISLYALTGWGKNKAASAEAGLKYFLFGSTASALFLYGVSLLYGITHHLDFPGISTALATTKVNPALAVSMILILAGLGFKVAAVPFHLWAPDVYQGAPTPSASFVASASKVGAFALLLRLLGKALPAQIGNAGYHLYAPGWMPIVAFLAAFSMLLGAFVALRQKSVKRLLAYSAISHAGYMLIGTLVLSGTNSVIFYVTTYAFAAVGLFGVVSIVEKNTGSDTMENWSGLVQRSPLLAGSAAVFILSMAGIPPLAGFFGKFFIFAEVLQAPSRPLSLLWLVIVGLAASAVSLYYYLVLLKHIFVLSGKNDFSPVACLPVTRIALLGLSALVILTGIFPKLILQLLSHP